MSLNPEDFRAQADAGDGQAQYFLAAALSGRGEHAEADKWLREAAANRFPDALFTLATRRLGSRSGAVAAREDLIDAANAGSTVALRLLAVFAAEGVGAAADWRIAVDYLMQAARAGDASALRELAVMSHLTTGNAGPGPSLLAAAASADGMARVLTTELGFQAQPAAKIDETLWSELSDGAVKFLRNGSDDPEIISRAPDIRRFKNAIDPQLAFYVIVAAAPRLAPSTVFDPRTGASIRDPYRSSATATLGLVDLDLVLCAVNLRLSGLAGVDPSHGEFLSVLRYQPGEEYKPHFDWLPPGEDFDRGGQRVATALLYLNSGYDGGETVFTDANITVSGDPGDVLVFRNTTSDGAPDQESRHSGRPVDGGVKWLASKWFRENEYQF